MLYISGKLITYGIQPCMFAVSKFNGVSVMTEDLQCGMVGVSWSICEGPLVRPSYLAASSKTFKQ